MSAEIEGLVHLVDGSIGDTEYRLGRLEKAIRETGDSQVLVLIGEIQGHLENATLIMDAVARRLGVE